VVGGGAARLTLVALGQQALGAGMCAEKAPSRFSSPCRPAGVSAAARWMRGLHASCVVPESLDDRHAQAARNISLVRAPRVPPPLP
jgi:hypothetical protein